MSSESMAGRSTSACHRVAARSAFGRLAFVVAFLWAGTSAAQSTDVYDLSRQISELQRDLSRLQQYVYSAPPAAQGRSSGGPIDLNPEYRERVEVRLSELEGQLRELTGRVEEVSFSVRRLEGQIEKLVADVDFRLGALERGAGAGPAPGDPSTGTVPAPTTADGRPGGDQSALAQGGGSDAGRTEASLPAGSAAEQYERAQQLLAQARHDDAEAALRRFLQDHPDHRLAENARYWLGESYYVRKRYEEAASTFLEGYKQHPSGSKAPDNLLKLGLSLGALNKDKEACVAINRLLREYPDSPDHIRRRAEQEKQAMSCG